MTKDWQHDFSLPVVSRKLNGFKMTRSEWLGRKMVEWRRIVVLMT
uniref:Uncharacterized protein n=1 Tax=Wuchereria bancrofti TaxID=6293 RepID=A0AAF5PPI3_WUCBA